ncbi:MAG: restriction endonuclease subunit S [Endomicrobia bacterium]|nr:restriction endonuclease subunit S [Endomicrobiia bacterium]MCL2506172.1 restriction endonuclease subunit S [Endomicrobiia bacterium]
MQKDWEYKRLKYCFDEHRGGAWGDEPIGNANDYVCVRVADFDYRSLSINSEEYTIRNYTDSQIEKLKLSKGDILIEKSGGGEKTPVGRAVIFDKDFDALYANFIEAIKVNNENSGYFFNYLFSTLYSTEINRKFFNQTTGIQNLDVTAYLNQKYNIPPLKTQKKIVGFLDKKTAVIDNLIKDKEKLIGLLKEKRQAVITEAVIKGLNKNPKAKSSSINWIGNIPEGWDRVKIKHLLEVPITDGPHETPVLFDEGIPFVSAESIKNGKVDFDLKRGFISKEEHERFCKKCKPRKNDIFMVKSGATTGNIAIVDTDEEFSIWSPLALIRCNEKKLLTEYMFKYMQSSIFRRGVEMFWNYGTQQNIGMKVLENLFVILPSLEEQKKISLFIEDKISNIDKAITDIETQIEKLQECRKSIISEAVIGKVAI